MSRRSVRRGTYGGNRSPDTMELKRRRPVRSARSNRATGSSEELFGGAFRQEHSNARRHEQWIARVHVFVSRSGRIGYHITECPICWDEHIHGPYPIFDPRERQGFAKFQNNLSCAESLGWRAPHCFHDCRSEYELVLVAEPARYAPGAQHSPLAGRTMKYLLSIGFPNSNETISSTWPPSRWRWL